MQFYTPQCERQSEKEWSAVVWLLYRLSLCFPCSLCRLPMITQDRQVTHVIALSPKCGFHESETESLESDATRLPRLPLLAQAPRETRKPASPTAAPRFPVFHTGFSRSGSRSLSSQAVPFRGMIVIVGLDLAGTINMVISTDECISHSTMSTRESNGDIRISSTMSRHHSLSPRLCSGLV